MMRDFRTRTKLSPEEMEERRLSAESYGVKEAYVYKLRAQALRDVDTELSFWQQVKNSS